MALLTWLLVHRDNPLHVRARCRAHGPQTVVGGPGTSSVAGLRRHPDTIVIGEAENLMEKLTRDLEDHQAAPVYRAGHLSGLDETPFA